MNHCLYSFLPSKASKPFSPKSSIFMARGRRVSKAFNFFGCGSFFFLGTSRNASIDYIVSPAVNFAAYDPIQWLYEFFGNCTRCKARPETGVDGLIDPYCILLQHLKPTSVTSTFLLLQVSVISVSGEVLMSGICLIASVKISMCIHGFFLTSVLNCAEVLCAL